MESDLASSNQHFSQNIEAVICMAVLNTNSQQSLQLLHVHIYYEGEAKQRPQSVDSELKGRQL